MASSDNRWNTAHEDSIDALVGHLKRTRRFSRDGRALRGLNRHWCGVLNKHVTDINPYLDRELEVGDIDGLLKFSNLSRLNTLAFETSFGKELPLGRLTRTMSQLPHLKRLEVHRLFDSLGNETVSKLTQVTSLSCLHLPSSDVIDAFQFPIEELTTRCPSEELVQWIKRLPDLKSVDIIYPPPGQDVGDKKLEESLMKIERLKIRYLGLRPIDFLVPLTNLVSLCTADIETEMDLPRLTSLEWRARGMRTLRNKCLRRWIPGLETLHLSVHDHSDVLERMPDNILAEAKNLKELALRGATLRPGLANDLSKHQLTKLVLEFCTVPIPLSFIEQLVTLKSLRIGKLYYLPKWELDFARLRNLTYLDIVLRDSFTNTELMERIVCMTQLESLLLRDDVYNDDPNAKFVFESLNALPNLQSLTIQGKLPHAAMESFLALTVLTTLETLTVETCCFLGKSYQEMVEKGIDDLMTRVPRLKIQALY